MACPFGITKFLSIRGVAYSAAVLLYNAAILLCSAAVLLCAFSFAKSPEKDPLLLSPTFLLGIPHPLNVALDAKIEQKFSVGLGGGLLSYAYKAPDGYTINLGTYNYEMRVRFHPFSGAFFLGAAIGKQRFSCNATQEITVEQFTVPTTVDLAISALTITPHLGWFWIKKSGFTIGFELGWLFPISPKTEWDVSTTAEYNAILEQVEATEEYKRIERKLQDIGNRIGSLSIPFVTLLRLGWTF
ncbi:MAG: hypothetical protein HY537_01435 [Deltaproteobacteria bacterium]|nr:hypothetical protein [Deltaproteobacteria bacterium]